METKKPCGCQEKKLERLEKLAGEEVRSDAYDLFLLILYAFLCGYLFMSLVKRRKPSVLIIASGGQTEEPAKDDKHGSV